MSLTKSKQRVADHGEVFTPEWMVEAMLDLVKGETERIDSRFLEPACGSGNFLVKILQRKFAAVELKYGKSDFERRHFALRFDNAVKLAGRGAIGEDAGKDDPHESGLHQAYDPLKIRCWFGHLRPVGSEFCWLQKPK